MKNDELKIVSCCTAVFAMIAIAVCLWRSATKPIAIAVQAQAPTPEVRDELSPYEMSSSKVLALSDAPPGGEDLTIPLPGGVVSEDIQTENHYLSGQFWINIRANGSRYAEGDSGILADRGKVSECVYVTSETSTCSLRFGLTGVYEPQMSLVDGVLHISLMKPAETYEHIVLVDPMPVTQGTDDLPLETAQALEELYRDDSSIRIYLTRTGQEYHQETALRLLKETEADFLIRIGTQNAPGEEAFRMVYNGNWYLRRYTNAEFSRDLASGIAESSDRMFTELSPEAGEDPLMTTAEIPAAEIFLTGNTSAENSWLRDSRTPGRIAEGISKALQTASETLKERSSTEAETGGNP